MRYRIALVDNCRVDVLYECLEREEDEREGLKARWSTSPAVMTEKSSKPKLPLPRHAGRDSLPTSAATHAMDRCSFTQFTTRFSLPK